MKIKTIIIEDEVNARKALENMLSFYCPEIEIAGFAASVKEMVLIDETSVFHLIISNNQLDIVNKIIVNKTKLLFKIFTLTDNRNSELFNTLLLEILSEIK